MLVLLGHIPIKIVCNTRRKFEISDIPLPSREMSELFPESEIPHDSVVEAIIKKFRERSAVGWRKYGTTLDRGDLGVQDWIQHAQEELMDGILYLEKLKRVYLPETLVSAGAASGAAGASAVSAGAASGAAVAAVAAVAVDTTGGTA